jgi:hypothetical protein
MRAKTRGKQKIEYSATNNKAFVGKAMMFFVKT